MFVSKTRKKLHRPATAIIASLIATIIIAGPVAEAASKGPSGLPLPRYVSLKASRVNMRVGPGRDYKVDWMYTKRGLPLEILQEYDNWRKVRDPEGTEGWILQSLLSGTRTAIVAPWKRGEKNNHSALRKGPLSTSAAIAKLEAGVLAKVSECIDGWCKMSVKGVNGYIEQASLWGVYPNENIE